MKSFGAVITADIVNSTRIEGDIIDDLRNSIEDIIRSKFTPIYSFYRGDSLQCYLESPSLAYLLALILRTEAKIFLPANSSVKIDLKISVGIGNVEVPVKDVKTGKGAAFIISGRGLDELERNEMRISIRSEEVRVNNTLEVISIFTDYIFNQLTYKQAEILKYLLNNSTQIEIASILNKSQSTINKHLQSMGWKQLEDLMRYYNQSLKEISVIHG